MTQNVQVNVIPASKAEPFFDGAIHKHNSSISSLVKKRDAFCPFAPAVTIEAAAEYFEIEKGVEALYASMLFVTQVREPYRKRFPSITHVDGSARVGSP